MVEKCHLGDFAVLFIFPQLLLVARNALHCLHYKEA